MKPVLFWLIILVFIITSCSRYTWPIYAKGMMKKAKLKTLKDGAEG
jgi:hypothetical protein